MKNTRNASVWLLATEFLEDSMIRLFQPLIYLRNIVGGLTFLVLTLVLSLGVLPFGFLGLQRIVNYFIYTWAKSACICFGLKVQLTGADRIPKSKHGFLYVFNHTSHLDIVILYAILPRLPRFGAKIELYKIPVFSWAMKAAGTLPIPRANRAEALQIYAEAEKRVENGETFILAPEGTRQPVEEIGPFKTGPFIFAINAKMPLVPVVIKGAYDALPKGHNIPNWGKWSTTVNVQILSPIPTQGLGLESRPSLQNDTREKMVQAFNRM